MHLALRLPQVQPNMIQPPTRCPLRRRNGQPCSGTHFTLHQVVCRKSVRDTKYTEVVCHRFRCLKCKRFLQLCSGQAVPRLPGRCVDRDDLLSSPSRVRTVAAVTKLRSLEARNRLPKNCPGYPYPGQSHFRPVNVLRQGLAPA